MRRDRAGQRVAGGDGHHGRLVAQPRADDALARLGAEPERQLQPAVGDLLGERAGAVLARAHAHARAPARELGEQRLGDVVGAGREPESQLAGLAPGVAEGCLGRRVGGLDGGARGREHRRPGLGQLHPRARAVEQPDAELALEPRDLLAERRLGHVQALGGAAEVQLVGERDERAQQPRVGHARSL